MALFGGESVVAGGLLLVLPHAIAVKEAEAHLALSLGVSLIWNAYFGDAESDQRQGDQNACVRMCDLCSL